MANIMLTDKCNLHCPYCFANEFVNHSANEISMENFEKALDFIATGGNKVGLIGGEPTLHSKFKDILRMLIEDNRFQNVMLFTNGVLLDQFVNELAHPKFKLLINCNSEADMGEINYRKMCDNIDSLVREHYMKDKITLGYNIFQKEQDFTYLLKLLRKYHFHKVRIAITVPNTDEGRLIDAVQYFETIKQNILTFLRTMMENGVVPYYDCNKLPMCILSEKEKKKLKNTFDKMDPDLRREYGVSPDLSIFTDTVQCEPVIDIRQDLTAVRCFGLSSCTKTSIADFKSLGDLRRFYMSEIDAYARMVGISPKCKGCYERKVMNCTGGCYAYNIRKMQKVKNAVESYL